jgi:hypothetical protein
MTSIFLVTSNPFDSISAFATSQISPVLYIKLFAI